jgi:hypothetical protein
LLFLNNLQNIFLFFCHFNNNLGECFHPIIDVIELVFMVLYRHLVGINPLSNITNTCLRNLLKFSNLLPNLIWCPLFDFMWWRPRGGFGEDLLRLNIYGLGGCIFFFFNVDVPHHLQSLW